jgi:hypothetical protein
LLVLFLGRKKLSKICGYKKIVRKLFRPETEVSSNRFLVWKLAGSAAVRFLARSRIGVEELAFASVEADLGSML